MFADGDILGLRVDLLARLDKLAQPPIHIRRRPSGTALAEVVENDLRFGLRFLVRYLQFRFAHLRGALDPFPMGWADESELADFERGRGIGGLKTTQGGEQSRNENQAGKSFHVSLVTDG